MVWVLGIEQECGCNVRRVVSVSSLLVSLLLVLSLFVYLSRKNIQVTLYTNSYQYNTNIMYHFQEYVILIYFDYETII